MYKIGKIGYPILIDEGLIWWKYFLFGVKKYKFS